MLQILLQIFNYNIVNSELAFNGLFDEHDNEIRDSKRGACCKLYLDFPLNEKFMIVPAPRAVMKGQTTFK